MLKNNIFRELNRKKRNDLSANDLFDKKVFGRVQVWGKINGEVVHYDDGNNTVMDWSKHAIIQMISGEPYSTHGNHYNSGSETIYSLRDNGVESHTTSNNIDGTVISGEEYLSDNTNFYDHEEDQYNHKIKPIFDLNSRDNESNFNSNKFFPFFPTKMLFGTGREYSSWDAIPEDYKATEGALYEFSYSNPKNGGWSENTFDNNIDNDLNYFSNEYNYSKSMIKCRTVNDVSTGDTNSIDFNVDETSIAGAIKNAFYDGTDPDRLEVVGNHYFAKQENKGLGRPSFVYLDRSGRNFESSEVEVASGKSAETEGMETLASFTVTLPSQGLDGVNYKFYPYNGYLLKEVGLFSDAVITKGGEVPESGTPSLLSRSMPCGIMWAKRNITPVFKNHEMEITVKWTLYYA